MIVAIMQPYFFPYIGYFQLMAAVDAFVYYDDAQYMKGGWINRNRILQSGDPAWLTMPIVRAPITISINNRHYLRNATAMNHIKSKLNTCYARAPLYLSAIDVLNDLLGYSESNVAAYNIYHLTSLAARFGMHCHFLRSSELEISPTLFGQNKILAICEQLNATCYINAIGGMNLYDAEVFNAHGLRLEFIKPNAATYIQFDNEYVPYLSIIDLMMFNDTGTITAMLKQFQIVNP